MLKKLTINCIFINDRKTKIIENKPALCEKAEKIKNKIEKEIFMFFKRELGLHPR